MTNEDIAVQIEAHEHEIGSLKHRMKAAEEATTVLNRLATAVEVMATKQDTMAGNVSKLTEKVDTIEAKPAKRWDGLVDKILYAIAGAFVMWLFSGAPGM